MSEDKFNFQGLVPPLRAEGTDGQLTIGEYMGYLNMTAFVNGSVGPRIPLNWFSLKAISKGFANLKKAQSGTRAVALNINEWDPATRKQSFKCSVVLGRAEDGQFYIELKDKTNAAIKFMFKWPAMITYSSDPVDAAANSLEALLVWEELWNKAMPEMMILARLNYTPPKGRGGNRQGGNSGGNRSSGGNNNNNSGSEDDLY